MRLPIAPPRIRPKAKPAIELVAAVPDRHPGDQDHRGEDDAVEHDPGHPAAVAKQAEGDSGVVDVGQPEPGHDRHPAADIEPVHDQVLGDPIEGHDNERR